MLRTFLPLALLVAVGVVLALAQPPAVKTSAQTQPAAAAPAPNAPPPPADATASSATVLQPMAAGSVHVYGTDVQYLFVKTDLPGSTRLGGTSLVFVPPVDFPRNPTNGEPLLDVTDPTRLCDGLWASVNGHPKLFRTAKEIANAVQDGELDAVTPVDVRFTLTLHDEPALRLAVWEGAQTQLQKMDEPLKPVAPGATSADMAKRAAYSVNVLPAKSLRLKFETPGLEALALSAGNGSNIANRLTMQGRVPVGLIARLYTRSGVTMRLESVFDSVKVGESTVNVKETVSAFVRLLMSATGDGGTTAATGDATGSVQILSTRDSVNRTMESLRASRVIDIEAVSTEDANFLAALMQQGLTNLPGVAADKIGQFIEREYDTKKALESPGVVTAFQRLGEKKQLTDQEAERFYSDFQSHGKKSSGGGGFSLGPVSFGGGGGSETQTAAAHKQQSRDAMRKFASDLYEYKTTGSFPVQPKLAYTMASASEIEQQVDQKLRLRRSGKVAERVLSSRFTSNADTLAPSDTEYSVKVRELMDSLKAKMEAPPKLAEPKK